VPFVVLHPCLSDEQFSIREGSDHIGQVIVGFAVKDVVNGKRRILWGGQADC
jgi:hypothetical protein